VKPTRKQLAYLRGLAEQTGTTFAYAATSAEASAQSSACRHGRARAGAGDVRRVVQRDL
jgi:hypothetical protein